MTNEFSLKTTYFQWVQVLSYKLKVLCTDDTGRLAMVVLWRKMQVM